MNAELLSMIAGSVLSLIVSYVPGVSDWYAGLDGTRKRLVMLGILLAAALVVFGLSCANVLDYVSCDRAGALEVVKAFFAAAIANQTTFLLSPRKE